MVQIEWYKIWVPFVATLVSALISALVAIRVNYKQNKENNERIEKEFNNTLKKRERESQLSNNWNAKIELLELKTKQGEILFNNIIELTGNIQLYYVSNGNADLQEHREKAEKKISIIQSKSNYFPNLKSEIDDILNQISSNIGVLVTDYIIKNENPYTNENVKKIAESSMEINYQLHRISEKVSKDILNLISELEQIGK